MEYHIGSANDGRDLVIAADIGSLQIHRRGHLLQILLAPAEEIVDHDHSLSALPQQAAHQGGPDKTGAARYHVFAHVGSSAIRASRYRSESLAIFSAPGLKSKASSDTQPR